MKKIFLLIALCISLVPGQMMAQSNMIDNGFSLKFSFGFPPSEYGFTGDIPVLDQLAVDVTYGLEIGNQWYFYENNQFGLGLDINWLDIVYSSSKIVYPLLGEIKRITLEGSFIEFGPVASLAVNDWLAFDGYYNLRPSYMASYFYQNTDDYVLMRDFSFLHGLGIGVRMKIFYLGYEYTLGSFSGVLLSDGEFEDVQDEFSNQKMDAVNSKLIIGFQF